MPTKQSTTQAAIHAPQLPTDPPTSAPLCHRPSTQAAAIHQFNPTIYYICNDNKAHEFVASLCHPQLPPHPASLSPIPIPWPCNACRRLSMHRNLRAAATAAAATPTANNNCWATRDILYTDTDTTCPSPSPLHPPAPPPTPALFYLSVGSRHSQLPFRIELNSNFYQFTKATAGKAKKGSQAASVGGQGRSYGGMRGVSGEVCAQPRNINDGKESWQQSF